MKADKKRKARELRAYGYSLNEIVKELNVSKSTASLWVRDIVLSKDQEKKLSERVARLTVIEKRRQTRLKNEGDMRQQIIDHAKKEVKILSPRELWLAGLLLYWAKGSNTQRGIVRFTNSNPEVIKLMMRFFRKCCEVPEEKLRGHLQISSYFDQGASEKYWSELTGIPTKRFFRPSIIRQKKGKKERFRYGVFDIYICNTKLFLKIQGWISGIFSSF